MILRVKRSPAVMPPVPSEGEISPLRSASVEMTEGAGRLFFHWGREISPLRFASVEMTRGALAATVISSGGFMRRLSRSVLFCPLHRGEVPRSGKGGAA